MITTHNLTEAQLLADRIVIIRHGRIIANGTIDQLGAQIVGDPLMELRVNGEVNGLHSDLASMVRVDNYGQDWLQYRTTDPHMTNPQILKKCIELGVEVVTLSQKTKTLEDIYLQVVEEDEAQERKQV